MKYLKVKHKRSLTRCHRCGYFFILWLNVSCCCVFSFFFSFDFFVCLFSLGFYSKHTHYGIITGIAITPPNTQYQVNLRLQSQAKSLSFFVLCCPIAYCCGGEDTFTSLRFAFLPSILFYSFLFFILTFQLQSDRNESTPLCAAPLRIHSISFERQDQSVFDKLQLLILKLLYAFCHCRCRCCCNSTLFCHYHTQSVAHIHLNRC